MCQLIVDSALDSEAGKGNTRAGGLVHGRFTSMQLLVGVKIEHSKSKYCSLFTFDEITPPFSLDLMMDICVDDPDARLARCQMKHN